MLQKLISLFTGKSPESAEKPSATAATVHKGGCDHVHVMAHGNPIDNHECHCNVCKAVTGQHTTHVAFYDHDKITVNHPEKINRQPFNADNPNGPLDLCTCADCGAPLMLDDRQERIRVAVPNVMGYDDAAFPKADYHAFYDTSKGYDKPSDGRPVYDGLRPDFTWPKPKVHTGGCDHVKITAVGNPIDNHECHCNVCKSVTGQHTTHVAFYNWGDVTADHPEKIARQPFNADNPDGPLELCTCADCGAPLMLDDKEKRIRVVVPNVMGYDDAAFPAADYHAFYDEAKGYDKPSDGRPVLDGLRPDFVWPKPA